MIISLLGTSVYKTMSLYKNNTKLNIKNDKFINSNHVFLESFPGEVFIFLGSEKSIKVHKENKIFQKKFESENVTFIEFDSADLNDIFIKIMTILIENQDKKIIFDITHSFRDAVIMSVISTLVSQSIYKANIIMVYAKDTKYDDKIDSDYCYELVSEDILNTSNIAFILTSFLNTLKVPPLSQTELYELLNNFSIHLVSNQFQEVYEKDIVKLENYIKQYKEKLFFVSPLLNELTDILNKIKETKAKKNFEKFLFFSQFFLRKDYLLQSATYLIEAITYYIGYIFKELKYIDFNVNEYENQQKIVSLLKLNYNSKDFNFPNDYFVDINIDVINSFDSLRNKIAEIRHNLAHINIEKEYGNLGNELDLLIKEFKSLVDAKILHTLDNKDDKKIYTVKYRLEKIAIKSKSLVEAKGQNSPKLETLIKKYKENTLNDLMQLNMKRTRKFINEYSDEIQKLFELKKKRKLLQIPIQKDNKDNKVAQNQINKEPVMTSNKQTNHQYKKRGLIIVKKAKEKKSW